MSPLVLRALAAITRRTNLSTGLVHSNDENAAKELFLRLHDAGCGLDGRAIAEWAKSNGWQQKDAVELGDMASRINAGRKIAIKDGRWWRDDILDTLSRDD